MKTIEEAAVIAAANYDNPFDEPAYDKKFYDGFLAGANHIMSLPLAERLTTEERDLVITKYNAVKIGATECDSPECAYMMDLLEDIFDKEMFEEEGGRNV